MSTPFSDQVLESAAPILAYDATGQYQQYLLAFASLADFVTSIITDVGYPDQPTAQTSSDLTDGQHYLPGYGGLLDPDFCPANLLPYLAQFVGVSIPVGTDETTARMIVKQEPGHQRGTLAAMQSAALRYISDGNLLIRERRGGGVGSVTSNISGDYPYHGVFAFTPAGSGIPAGSYTATSANIAAYPLIAAVEAAKPAGIQISYISTLGFPWSTAINAWSADTFSWASADTTQP